ncbi:lipopolysaccharide biosynthesis protein [Acidihalobacter yilgarnensis]|uniref:lipopolysaccharide biosynthesis protein n=1 Tax=Acidihalobacter yilgarnensis TaxID=2819280 RepID=UPI0009F60B19|nr:lipopolysaccharide biosynthesis protein [Acidihalobacter yilgarnensis]
MTNRILSSIANGALWTALARLSARSIGLVSTLVLARLLTPHDFGLVALGMVFIGFLQLLGSFDFDTVIIQHPAPTQAHYDTAWTFNALYFTVAAVALIIAAPAISRFYETPALTDILYVLAGGFVLTGLNSIKTVDFQKHFRFKYDFALTLSGKIVGVVVTITSAFLFKNYWALLAGFIATRLTLFFMGYYLAPYRPHITLSERRSLFRFSSWLMLKNLFYFINNKSTELIIGKMLGTLPLGIFTVGSDIANMPSQELTSTINRAAYPGYAKLATQHDALKKTILYIYNVIATVAIPVSIGLYFVAKPLVQVVLGEKWLPAIPIVEIISISGLFISLQSNFGYVFFALNKPNIDAIISGLRALILIPLVYFLSRHYGVSGAALALLITSIATLPLSALLLRHYIGLSMVKIALSALRPVISALAMSVALLTLPFHREGISPMPDAFFALISMVAVGAFTYISTLSVTWFLAGRPDGIEKAALDRLSRWRTKV